MVLERYSIIEISHCPDCSKRTSRASDISIEGSTTRRNLGSPGPPGTGEFENLKGLANVSAARGLRSLEPGIPRSARGPTWPVSSLAAGRGLIESHIAPAFANSLGPAFWEMPCICAPGYMTEAGASRGPDVTIGRTRKASWLHPSTVHLFQQHQVARQRDSCRPDRRGVVGARSWIPPASNQLKPLQSCMLASDGGDRPNRWQSRPVWLYNMSPVFIDSRAEPCIPGFAVGFDWPRGCLIQ